MPTYHLQPDDDEKKLRTKLKCQQQSSPLSPLSEHPTDHAICCSIIERLVSMCEDSTSQILVPIQETGELSPPASPPASASSTFSVVSESNCQIRPQLQSVLSNDDTKKPHNPLSFLPQTNLSSFESDLPITETSS